MQTVSSPYYAAIDLGSNSFHMLIIRMNDKKIEIVDREKDMVQIARGLEKRALSVEVQQRAITCLQKFSERLRDIPPQQIRAVGTKTLRAAKNARQFLQEATTALGVPIEIISGYEEARLVYSGLAHTVSDNDNQRLVIDIGGGSTELVIGKGYAPFLMESLSLGCASFTQRFFAAGVNKGSMQEAYLAACTEMLQIRNKYRKLAWQLAYGTSGTMKAIAQLLELENGAIITREGVEKLSRETVDNGGITTSKLPKLRREVLPAGIAILRAIFDTLGIDTLRVANATLKEGLIYDTIGRFSDKDIRAATVQRIGEQYAIDIDQATRVSQTALQLWKQISSPNIPGISRTKILGWAAQLHEIGLNISHSGYHHHGHYILKHSDLAGFGRYEQQILAKLVNCHRKKLDSESLAGMSEAVKACFISLIICLRLAVVLHRRRDNNLEMMPKINVEDNKYSLKFAGLSLEDSPLTTAGLEQEAHYLKNIGIKLCFK